MATGRRSKSIACRRKILHVEADPVRDSDQLYLPVTIGVLPDDVLLEIFVYVVRKGVSYWNPFEPKEHENEWRTLVHVCKQWRCVVFASPRRLDLQLLCRGRRPVKKLLDIWPPFPLYISAHRPFERPPFPSYPDVIAALKEHDRVCGIYILHVPVSLLKRIAAIQSFPVLMNLILSSEDKTAPVLPASFLGGSAPRLRTLWLQAISFPGLGKLLLSTVDLVKLHLRDIPHSGYISPEMMVASLSTLTRLEQLDLGFRSPRSRTERDNRQPPPSSRIVIPALTRLWLKGDSEYFEDIFSRIDAPRLDDMNITFFNQLVFDTPHLHHFIRHTEKLKAPDYASIQFNEYSVSVILSYRLKLYISCNPLDWQLSSLAQLYNSALSPLPTLKRLEIRNSRIYRQDDMEIIQWLELVHLFPSVKDMVISEKTFRLLAPALDELAGDSVTEVLPALQNIFLQGRRQPSEPDKKTIGRFVDTRQVFGCPITVQHRHGEDLD